MSGDAGLVGYLVDRIAAKVSKTRIKKEGGLANRTSSSPIRRESLQSGLRMMRLHKLPKRH